MPQARPSAADMHRLRDLIEAAERPLLLLGGSRWSNTVRKAVHDFALRFDLPVATAWRRLELFDNDHPNFVGQVSASMPAHQKHAASGRAACRARVCQYV